LEILETSKAGEAHKAQKIDRLLINHGTERPVGIIRGMLINP